MSDVFLIFNRVKILITSGWIVIEQLLVALSTVCLLQAMRFVDGNRDVAVYYLMGYLFCLSAPFIPGIFARKGLEDLVQTAFANLLERRLIGEKSGILFWAQKRQKESFLTSIGTEGLSQIRQVAHTGFDLFTIVLNIILNLTVLGMSLSSTIAWGFVCGIAFAILIFHLHQRKVEDAATSAQTARSRLFNLLQRAWDNIWAAHPVHRKPYVQALRQDLDGLRHSSVKAIVSNEVASISTTLAISVPVMVSVVFLAGYDSAGSHLGSILVTLPRQFQVIGNIQVLVGYLTILTALSAQLKVWSAQLKVNEIEPGVFITEDRITVRDVTGSDEDLSLQALQKFVKERELSNGRYVLIGPNGSGKSTFLVSLKAALEDEAYFLPSHSDFWLDVESRGLSSGERIVETFKFLISNGVPRFVLVDEWDANLDPHNRALVDHWLDQVARSSVVIEVRHHGVRHVV